MKSRAHNGVVFVLSAVLLMSVAAPGLTLHNCRRFGTRSTQLCDCCAPKTAGSCCASNPDSSTPARHRGPSSGTPGFEAACCFTSYEGPFSFDGQSSISNGTSTVTYVLGDCPVPDSHGLQFALSIDKSFDHSSKHSSDPPSYILTHSFRC